MSEGKWSPLIERALVPDVSIAVPASPYGAAYVGLDGPSAAVSPYGAAPHSAPTVPHQHTGMTYSVMPVPFRAPVTSAYESYRPEGEGAAGGFAQSTPVRDELNAGAEGAPNAFGPTGGEAAELAKVLDLSRSVPPPPPRVWFDDPIAPGENFHHLSRALAFVLVWVISRGATLILLMMHGFVIDVIMAIAFIAEVVMAWWWWRRRMYFPGNIYNELHVLLTRRVLRKVYYSDRFTAKFRFFFTLWGYFVIAGTVLNLLSTTGVIGDEHEKKFYKNSWSLTLALVAAVFSAREIFYYVPLIMFWYAGFVLVPFEAFLWLLYHSFCCCWCRCRTVEGHRDQLCYEAPRFLTFRTVVEHRDCSYKVWRYVYEKI